MATAVYQKEHREWLKLILNTDLWNFDPPGKEWEFHNEGTNHAGV